MDSRTCLVTKLQSGRRLPYSRMSKNNKTHQPKGNKKTVAEEEKGNNLQEPPKKSLLQASVHCRLLKIQGTDGLSGSQWTFSKGRVGSY